LTQISRLVAIVFVSILGLNNQLVVGCVHRSQQRKLKILRENSKHYHNENSTLMFKIKNGAINACNLEADENAEKRLGRCVRVGRL